MSDLPTGAIEARQAYALANPATDPSDALNPALRSVRKHAKGWHIMTILAVDR